MRTLINFVLGVAWIAGIVIAKGFWSTLIAVVIPFWAWYLLVERMVERFL